MRCRVTGRRGRAREIAIAASTAAHAVLLAFLAIQAPRLIERPEATVASDVIPVFILPRADRRSAKPRRVALPLHHKRSDETQAAMPMAPAPVGPPAPVAEAPSVDAPLSPGVRAALRRQGGCAERSGLSLTRDERDGCNERLGHGAGAAPYLKAPIGPEIRTYYDQVAKAKEPQGPLPPLKARGRLGLLEAMPTGMKGHGPSFGCKVALGPHGLIVVRPPHALHLGPCNLVPPAGSLSPDVDVQNPDDVVRHTGP